MMIAYGEPIIELNLADLEAPASIDAPFTVRGTGVDITNRSQIDTIVSTYLANRLDGETFVETWRRVGAPPFKEALYGTD